MKVLTKLNDGSYEYVEFPAGGLLYQASVIIPTASVLTLNTTPIEIVASPGAGKALQVVSAFASINTYGGTAYGAGDVLQIKTESVVDVTTAAQASNASILSRTAACKKPLDILAGASDNNTMFIADKGLVVSAPAANPTLGNSNIVVYCSYIIVTL